MFFAFWMSIGFAFFMQAMDQFTIFGGNNPDEPKPETFIITVKIDQTDRQNAIKQSKQEFLTGFQQFEQAYTTLLNQDHNFSDNDFAEISLELRGGVNKMVESKEQLTAQKITIQSDYLEKVRDGLNNPCTKEEMEDSYHQIKAIKDGLFKNEQQSSVMTSSSTLSRSFIERERTQDEIKEIERITENVCNICHIFFNKGDQHKQMFCDSINKQIRALIALINNDSTSSDTRIYMLAGLKAHVESTEEDIKKIITTVGLVSRVTLTKKKNSQDLLSSVMLINKEAEQGNYWPNDISGQITYIANLDNISDEQKIFVLQLMWWFLVGKKLEDGQDISRTSPFLTDTTNYAEARKEVYYALRQIQQKQEQDGISIHTILPSIVTTPDESYPIFYKNGDSYSILSNLQAYEASITSKTKKEAYSQFLESVKVWGEHIKQTGIKTKKRSEELCMDKKAVVLESLKKEYNFLVKFIKQHLAQESTLYIKTYPAEALKIKNRAQKRLIAIKEKVKSIDEDQKLVSENTLFSVLQERKAYLKKLLNRIRTNIQVKDEQGKLIKEIAYPKQDIIDSIHKEIAKLKERIKKIIEEEILPNELFSLNLLLNAFNSLKTPTDIPEVAVGGGFIDFNADEVQEEEKPEVVEEAKEELVVTKTPEEPEQQEIDIEEVRRTIAVNQALQNLRTIDSVTGITFKRDGYGCSITPESASNIGKYVSTLRTLADNINVLREESELHQEKYGKLTDEAVKVLDVTIEGASEEGSFNLKGYKQTATRQKTELKEACNKLVAQGYKEFTWITDEMHNEREDLKKTLFDKKEPVLLHANNRYLKRIAKAYPRPKIDQAARTRLQNRYIELGKKTISYWQEQEKALCFAVSVCVGKNTIETIAQEAQNSQDNYCQKLEIACTDIKNSRGFFSTIWNYRKYKRFVDSSERTKHKRSHTIDLLPLIRDYQDKSWLRCIGETIYDFITFKWLTSYLFPTK
jgi:hypothetical protein